MLYALVFLLVMAAPAQAATLEYTLFTSDAVHEFGAGQWAHGLVDGEQDIIFIPQPVINDFFAHLEFLPDNSVTHEPGYIELKYGQIISPVPLPAALWLFGSALTGLTIVARRSR